MCLAGYVTLIETLKRRCKCDCTPIFGHGHRPMAFLVTVNNNNNNNVQYRAFLQKMTETVEKYRRGSTKRSIPPCPLRISNGIVQALCD